MPANIVAPKETMPTEIVVSQPAAITPSQLLEIAVQRGASIEQMAQLFDLKLRVEADEARKAYNDAMAQFKRNPPQINKNKHVKFGNTEYDHATLDHAVDMITPALAAVDISAEWEPSYPDVGWMEVTCILTHKMGHSTRRSMKAAFDSSGSKNPVQAQASTLTYLERYTLLAATGLAAAGTDNDGRNAQTKPTQGQQLPVEYYAEAIEAIEGATTREALKNAFNPAFIAARDLGDIAAQRAFTAAKDKRHKELA